MTPTTGNVVVNTGSTGSTSTGVYTIGATGSTGISTGSTSSYLISGGGGAGSNWTTINNQHASIVSMSGNLHIDSPNPHLNTKKHKINIDKLYENMQILNEMFHIIVPDFNKFEKNPTLMDAYLQYDSAKHIEPRYNSEQYIAAYEQFKLLEALLEEEKHDNS